MGIKLSIDDFGTGYSSLSYLQRLPVDEIKIDQSFVTRLANRAEDDDDPVIVRSTIELAHNLGLTVVAEGVEDDVALNVLGTYRCDRAQGYFLGRPCPAHELTPRLTARTRTLGGLHRPAGGASARMRGCRRPPPEPAPPAAPRRPTRLEAHGDVRIDDWHWLRDRDDPAVIAYLEAENDYTEAMTAASAGLRERLYEQIKGRVQEDDLSAPARHGGWWYWSRTAEGSQYRIHCRLADPQRTLDAATALAKAAAGAGDVILDENALAQEHEFLHLGVFALSHDQRLLAYGVDHDGSERYALRFRDLASGSTCPTPSTTPATPRRGRPTARPCSTRVRTRRCVPTRSGATASAGPPTRTSACSTSPTSGSSCRSG